MHLIPVGLLALTAQLGLVLSRPMGDGASDSGEVTPEWTFSMLNTHQHSADLRNRDRSYDAPMMVGPSTSENEKVPDWSLETGMEDATPAQPNTIAARMISPNGNEKEKTPDWTLGMGADMGADMDSEQTNSDLKMMDGQNLNSNIKRQTVVPIPSSSVLASPTASPIASTTTSSTPSPTVPGDYGSYGEYGNYGDYANYGEYDGATLDNEIRQCDL
ncbi:hypothetical protein BDW72DRAFT_214577 [Aspergillus terricola var. indicus]